MTTTSTVRYRKGYKYQLAEDLELETGIRGFNVDIQFIRLTEEGTLTVKDGYASDGPSDPAIDTPNFMRGAFGHDALYQLMRGGYIPHEYKDKADDLLKQWCSEDGMCWIRTSWVHLGVRDFGNGSTLAINEKKVIEAP